MADPAESIVLFGYHQEKRFSYVEEQYPAWVRNNRLGATDMARLREAASRLEYRPLISVLLPQGEPDGNLLERTLDSVLGQAYPEWELRCAGDSETFSRYGLLDDRIKPGQGTLNDALSASEGEFAVVLNQDDEFAPDALFEAARLLQTRPEADVIYADSDSMDGSGRRFAPRFKPGFSPDLLLAADYISGPCFFRRSLAEQLGGFREEFGEHRGYDLLLRLTEETDGVHHVPKILHHHRDGGSKTSRETARRAVSDAMERRGIKGSVEDGLTPASFRVNAEVEDEPKVSIIIPTWDNHALLRRCVESVERMTSYANYEVIIVDNDSVDPKTVAYLSSLAHLVVPFKEEFNYSRINNVAVTRAGGEYILLLNDDTEVVSADWIEAMLQHAQRPEVGAVGARLLYPDGRIQHAGVVVGTGSPWLPGVATPAHQYYDAASPGYMGLAATTCNYSAVTAACMMLRKAVFEEVGGFDETNLKVNFNDVDLCLRLRERGYCNVYTPYAELRHYESASRGYKNSPDEARRIRRRWGHMIDDDPYYNPNFSLGEGDFNLRADMLRPKSLRRGGEEPGADLWAMKERDLRKYVVKMRENARSSRKTTLITPGGSQRTLLQKARRKGRDVGARLRRRLKRTRLLTGKASISPEQFVWVFGYARTGSTWLGRIIEEQPNQSLWFEPYVGYLFGNFHQKLKAQCERDQFILSDAYRGEWIEALKGFVVKGAEARFPRLTGDERLFVKEPNGSIGAPLVMEAMPESGMVFLLRDPRDVVSSALDAGGREGWNEQNFDLDTPQKLNNATRRIANHYTQTVTLVNEAYKAHPGRKAFVRYEDLRADTFGVMVRMYEALGVPVDTARLSEAIEKHSWENVPDKSKGSGKFFRKGQAGGWKEDLSEKQVEIIEKTTAPIISELYS